MTKTIAVQNKTKWQNSLQFKLNIGFIILLLIMVISVIIVIQTVGKRMLIEDNFQLIENNGNKIVSDLETLLSMTESLTSALANFGEAHEPDAQVFTEIVPNVMNLEARELLIAGGGIWPEPFMFNPQAERRSFFWGRNQAGELEYYDDYNDPRGPGYHHEEWYVPARHIDGGDCFWSQSYMDPYSYQPMVTCTVPMVADNDFIGAATIDLRLEGLQGFFENATTVTGGYAFAVDRNNRFISFPNEALTKVETTTATGNFSQQFITAQELADAQPAFQPVASSLSEINEEIITLQTNFNQQLADEIAADSYQINREEAELIAAILPDPLQDQTANSNLLKHFTMEDDLILNEPVTVFVFHMPQAYWKVVLVTPISQATGTANEISQTVLLYLIVIVILSLLFAFFWMRRYLLIPIRNMTEPLQKLDSGQFHLNIQLDDSAPNELGNLAYWFNRRSWELERLNDQLRAEISERQRAEASLAAYAAELERSNQDLQDFAYVASHDLQEPLRKIQAFSGRFQNRYADVLDERGQDYLKRMTSAAERLQTLIVDLLAYSRVTTKAQPFQEVDLTAVATHVVSDLDQHIKRVGGSITIDPLRVVEADETQMRQLFQNLISNALKFHQEDQGSVVHISGRIAPENGRFFEIHITDNGIGFEEQYADRIFGMFQRLHGRSAYAGTGIGLAVCRKIVERHGGTITATGTPDVGATFIVKLPIQQK